MPKPLRSRKHIKSSHHKSTAAKAGKHVKGTAKTALTAGQLLVRAQQAVAFEKYDAALECMREALQLEPENTEILDSLGALLAELGMVGEAVKELQKSVVVAPDEGYEKYMYLGQLLQGPEALAATQKGIELLQQVVEHTKQSGKCSKGLSKHLAAALCSLAEMKMTSAEDISAVSGDAEVLLEQAQRADPDSPEPLQALASLRYEQGRADEALQLLRQSMSKWFHDQSSDVDGSDDADGHGAGKWEQDEAADEDDLKIVKKPTTMSEEMDQAECGAEQDTESMVDEESDDLPSYEFRFECAKLLLELDDTTETAIKVLEDLIAENDSVPDVWHLLALSYYSGGMVMEAEEVCQSGMKILDKLQLGSDAELTCSFAELQSAIKEAQAVMQDAPAL